MGRKGVGQIKDPICPPSGANCLRARVVRARTHPTPSAQPARRTTQSCVIPPGHAHTAHPRRAFPRPVERIARRVCSRLVVFESPSGVRTPQTRKQPGRVSLPARALGTNPGGAAMGRNAVGDTARVRGAVSNPCLLTKSARQLPVPGPGPTARTDKPPRWPGLCFWVPFTLAQTGKGGHGARRALPGMDPCY